MSTHTTSARPLLFVAVLAALLAVPRQWCKAGEPVRTVVQTGHEIKEFDISPDDRYMVTADGHSVALWDVRKRRIIKQMSLDNSGVRADALFPGRFYALGFDEALKPARERRFDTYDILTGQHVGRRQAGMLGPVRQYVAEGLLTPDNGRLRIVPYSLKREIGVIDGHPMPAAKSLTVSPDGNMLYVGGDTPRIWDLAALKAAGSFSGTPDNDRERLASVSATPGYSQAVKAMTDRQRQLRPTVQLPEMLAVVNRVTPYFADGSCFVAHDAGGVGRYSGGKYSIFRQFDVPVTDVEVDPAQSALVVGTELGGLYTLDAANPQKITEYDTHEVFGGARVGAAQFLPGGYIAAGSSRNAVAFWKAGQPQPVASHDIHTAEVTDIAVSPDGSRFFSLDRKGQVVVWDAATRQPVVSIYPIGDSDYVFLTPDNYYTGSHGLTDYVHFARGLDVYGFDQFDLSLNRPDIVMQRMGAPDDVVDAYRAAWRKRVKKMGFTPGQLSAELHAPEVKVGDLPYTTDAARTVLRVEASDSEYPLARLMVYINGVPVEGRRGRAIPGSPKTYTADIPLDLASGYNLIQVSAINSRGVESYRTEAGIWRENPKPKADIYVAAIGVSEYSDAAFNLNCAAKDAADFIDLVGRHAANSGGSVKTLLLTDKEATLDNLARLRDFFAPAGRDDVAILYYAGHGLLDADMDYFLATSDVDFNNPSARGWAYDAFEDAVDNIGPLKKFCFIDACHSGEVDKEDFVAENTQKVAAGSIVFRAAGAGLRARSAGVAATRALVNDLFVDFRYGTGATVLSSSDGMEVSIEDSGVGNGLFTHAIKRAADRGEADANGDRMTSMSELSDFVTREVSTLSGGTQTPNMRLQNRQQDYILFK